MTTRRLIPYAGHDPSEVDPRNIHLDIDRVRWMRGEGMSWREVAEILTVEVGRRSAYTTDAVYAAARRCK